MNKQELIKKYEEYENGLFDIGARAACQLFLKDLEQLDEPEKVKVPQVVADMIEGARGQSVELEDAFEYVWEVATGELREWFRKLENRNNFAHAWLDGYEVENRYRVKMKGIVNALSFLSYHKKADIWTVTDINNSNGNRTHHTRKELEEAGFGWVFDCEGVEIEKVE